MNDHNEDWQRAIIEGRKPHPSISPLWRVWAVMGWIFVIILTAVASCRGEEFLVTLARVESGNNPNAVGRLGERGLYQFRETAWRQVNTLRTRRGLPHLNYYLSKDPVVSRSFAVEYLRWLSNYYTTARRRSPSAAELYALWNLGPTGFKRRGFSLEKCPAVTRESAMEFK